MTSWTEHKFTSGEQTLILRSMIGTCAWGNPLGLPLRKSAEEFLLKLYFFGTTVQWLFLHVCIHWRFLLSSQHLWDPAGTSSWWMLEWPVLPVSSPHSYWQWSPCLPWPCPQVTVFQESTVFCEKLVLPMLQIQKKQSLEGWCKINILMVLWCYFELNIFALAITFVVFSRKSSKQSIITVTLLPNAYFKHIGIVFQRFSLSGKWM